MQYRSSILPPIHYRMLSLLLIALAAQAQTLPTLSTTPSALTFAYQIGTTQLPAAQTVQIKRSGSGTALDFTVSVTPAAPWLIVTPISGKTGTAITVRVNPTSLIAGTYSTTIQIDAVGSAGPATATVVFAIKNPPPTMSASPAAMTFTWQTDASSPPAPQNLTVNTNGEPITVTATAAGGTWLSISPTVGAVVSGSPFAITVSVTTTGLVPGSYAGKITLASTTAANKTLTVTVTLTVSAGTAVLSSIWPNAASIGSEDSTITIRGQHLFKSTVIKANTTDLTATWISTDVMLAVVPKALLSSAATLQVTANNSPQPASNQLAFTVAPPGPRIQSVVNAASFSAEAGTPVLAPGEIISIFGSGLGPSTALIATPAANAFPTTLGSPATVVEFETVPGTWVPAPLIATSANLINCQVPFGIVAGSGKRLRITYNSITSSNFTYDGVAADPGVFTIDSSGRGQAAALNYNTTTGALSLNTSSNAAAKGGILVLYITGAGAINPLPSTDAALVGSSPIPTVVAVPSVTIGGEAASLLSATAVPGALGGLAQLNVTVPNGVKAGKELSVVITIGGRTSPATATVAVK